MSINKWLGSSVGNVLFVSLAGPGFESGPVTCSDGGRDRIPMGGLPKNMSFLYCRHVCFWSLYGGCLLASIFNFVIHFVICHNLDHVLTEISRTSLKDNFTPIPRYLYPHSWATSNSFPGFHGPFMFMFIPQFCSHIVVLPNANDFIRKHQLSTWTSIFTTYCQLFQAFQELCIFCFLFHFFFIFLEKKAEGGGPGGSRIKILKILL